MFKKLLPVVLVFAAVAMACNTVTPTPSPVPTSSPIPTVTPDVSAALTFATVEDGGSLTSTLEQSCDCTIYQFSDFGLIWLRNDTPVAVYKSKLAFELSGVAVLPYAYAGDTIVYGKVSDTLEYARNKGYYDSDPTSVLELEGTNSVQDGVRFDYLLASGNYYDKPVLYWQKGENDPWKVALSDGESVDAEAFNAVMQQGKTSSEADRILINQMQNTLQGN